MSGPGDPSLECEGRATDNEHGHVDAFVSEMSAQRLEQASQRSGIEIMHDYRE